MEEVEIKTVDTILDKGVRVPVPAPFFLRVFGKKVIYVVVRRPTLSILLLISKIYIKMNVDLNETNWQKWIEVFTKSVYPTARIVALGMLRQRLFHRLFARYLVKHIDAKYQAELASMLVSLSGVQDFTNTIRFIGEMKITAPTNLSQ